MPFITGPKKICGSLKMTEDVHRIIASLISLLVWALDTFFYKNCRRRKCALNNGHVTVNNKDKHF